MINGAGQEGVLRWQASVLMGGTVLAFLGTSFVLFAKKPGRLRSSGWWIAGISSGLLMAAFAFPVAALTAPPAKIDGPISATQPTLTYDF